MEAQLDALFGSGDFDVIAKLLDDAELESGAHDAWPFALHMLGHMVKGELENARFVWKRAPDARRAGDEELKAVFGLLQSMWTRDYPAVHHAAGGAGAAWSAKLAPVVQHLATTFRADTLALLTKAYTTVSVAHVASCLGVSEAEAAHTAAGLGWELDAAAGMLTVMKPPVTEQQQLALDSLQRLTEYTVHLSELNTGEKEA